MDTSLDRTITAAEIKSFIVGKRITGCVVCNHYDWRIKDDATALQCQCSGRSSTQASQTEVGIIILVCQNCGALEFHDRTVIASWLDCHRPKQTAKSA